MEQLLIRLVLNYVPVIHFQQVLIVVNFHLDVNGHQMNVKILIVQLKLQLEIVIKMDVLSQQQANVKRKHLVLITNMMLQQVVITLDVMQVQKEQIIYIHVKILQQLHLIQKIVELIQLRQIVQLLLVIGLQNVFQKLVLIKLKQHAQILEEKFIPIELFVLGILQRIYVQMLQLD